MLSRFLTAEPEELSLAEQVISALLAATLATVTAGIFASVLFLTVVTFLL